MSDLAEIKTALLAANHIAIITHVNPDGDAIGSLLGLGLPLRAAGKTVTLVTEKPIPDRFTFLTSAETIVQTVPAEADFAVAVDCSDARRLGNHQHTPIALNVDHHVTNQMFGRYNVVRSTALSTTEILTDLVREWQLPLTPDAANALLCGLVTDTLGFSVPATTPHTLRLAGDLVAAGANLSQVYRQGLNLQTLTAIRLWGVAFDRLQQRDGLLWTSLPLAEKQRIGYPARDDADVVNVIRNIEGSDVYVILVEHGPREVKISWRSEWMDVSQIAQQFDGGGHKPAAGATVYLPLVEAEQVVVEATLAALQAARATRNGQPTPNH